MTPEEFRAALTKLGLKQTGQEGATWFFDVNDTTVRRWARGAIEIPASVVMLLRVMIARKLSAKYVKSKFGREK